MDNLEIEKKIEKIKQPVVERGDFDIEQKEIQEKREKAKQKFEQVGRSEKEVEKAIKPSTQSGVGEPGIDTTKSVLHQKIEAILEEDLEEVYFSMNESQQARFKKKGEETAGKIIKLIKEEKSTFKKIFKLILSWLRFIPGVNKFFIEQESKIKTDRILSIKE